MTLVELQEKVAEDNDAVMKSLLVFGSQIPGTKAYFGQESKKAISMERWIRIMSGGKEMFNVSLLSPYLTFTWKNFTDCYLEVINTSVKQLSPI